MQRVEFDQHAVYFYNKHNQLRRKICKNGLSVYCYYNDEDRMPIATSYFNDSTQLAPLIVISATSASGKSTLVDSVVDTLKLPRLITTTTRKIRSGEVGNEYEFVTEDKFKEMMENDQFVEHACVYGNFYGLTKNELVRELNKPRIIILDVKGYKTIKSMYPNTVGIFILPPERTELERRLNERNGDKEDIARRLNEVDDELLNVDKYQYTIKPDSLEIMKGQLLNVINGILD